MNRLHRARKRAEKPLKGGHSRIIYFAETCEHAMVMADERRWAEQESERAPSAEDIAFMMRTSASPTVQRAMDYMDTKKYL